MATQADLIHVYTHSIEGEVFYVGCGQGRRPWSLSSRSTAWRERVAGRDDDVAVHIVESHPRLRAARVAEASLIWALSRKKGVRLVNKAAPNPAKVQCRNRKGRGVGMKLHFEVTDGDDKAALKALKADGYNISDVMRKAVAAYSVVRVARARAVAGMRPKRKKEK